MAYKPNRFTNVRDETYPSQIASERPALAPRIQCAEDYSVFSTDAEATLRGKERHDKPSPHLEGEDREDMCTRFNRQLRGGHGH